MGAGENIPLAGDAAARMRDKKAAGARKQSGRNPKVANERTGLSSNAVRRQEMVADRAGLISALQTQNPSYSEGITTDPTSLGRMSEGAPEYEQLLQRGRGMRGLRKTGSKK